MLPEAVQAADGLAKVLHDLVDEALSELAVDEQSARRCMRARASEREIFVAYIDNAQLHIRRRLLLPDEGHHIGVSGQCPTSQSQSGTDQQSIESRELPPVAGQMILTGAAGDRQVAAADRP